MILLTLYIVIEGKSNSFIQRVHYQIFFFFFCSCCLFLFLNIYLCENVEKNIIREDYLLEKSDEKEIIHNHFFFFIVISSVFLYVHTRT